MRVLERYGEGDTSRRKLRSQRIRIGHMEVGIPSGLRLTLAVGKRFNSDRLHHDHPAIAADNRKKWLVSGLLERNLKVELIAIEREGGRNVLPDEER
jgi:hypothetical protein